MIYSGKRNNNWGFFLEKGGVDPCLEITEVEHIALFEGQINSKVIKWHNDGTPYFNELPEPTIAEKAQIEIDYIKAEIEAQNYCALKAMKLGVDINELYLGEAEWYKTQITRIGKLEALITIAPTIKE